MGRGLGCSGLITFSFKKVMAMSKSPCNDLLLNHSIQSMDEKSSRTKESSEKVFEGQVGL
jgi:hypothetical protein